MNRIYRLVWNRTRSQWVAASELAPTHGKPGPARGRPTRRSARWASWSLGLSLGLPALVFAAAPAVAPTSLPTGGKVASGSGQIRQDGATLTVAQQSQNLSLNWQSFDIGSQATVNFVQPGQGAIAVNRIADTSGSRIMGHLNANGQVFLINPNGVLFGQGAQVNVGGLVASTLDVDDGDLGSGSLAFGGDGQGRVINKGSITTAPGGYVALVGHQVVNQGWIRAQLGGVALAGGSAVTLSFDGDSLVDVRVDQSTVNALARNGQLLQADGGQVWMTAGARDSLLASVVNNTGTVEAQTVGTRDGHITLLGGMQAGTVNVGGTLDASAPSGGDGGAIETSAAHAHIAGDALITTHAAQGHSGNWLIDPVDFTIAASGGDETGAQLSSALANGSVTIASSSGATEGTGSININDAVSWNANALTLTAADNININAVMTAGGSASLALNPAIANGGDTAVLTGTVNVMPGGGRVDFTGTGNSLRINGTFYTIITQLGSAGSTTETDLQGMDGNVGGHYALGADIDASATVGWNNGDGFTPIASNAAGFAGVFDGLGHTIDNLVIHSGNPDVGLFSATSSSAIVRNVGLSGGSVTASADGANVGGLVGYLAGKLLNVYSSAAVTGTAPNEFVGGLVGANQGWIQGAYDSGPVSTQVLSDFVGGLVGLNTQTIGYAYASGQVSGIGGDVIGGLIGTNIGTVTDTYAMGHVSAGGAIMVGGLVGSGSGSSLTGSYWDTQSTGQASSSGGTGVTSVQLRSALLSGFSSSTWGIVAGKSAPYLLAQFPSGTTPQVVSGTVYTDSGTAGAGIPVSGLVNGKPLASVNGSVETGGNGYYYFLLAPGTLSNGDGVLVYANNYGAGSSQNGVSFLDGYSSSNQLALNVYGNLLYVQTPSSTWSGVLSDLAVAEGNGATAGNALSMAGITPSYDINVAATQDFTVDSFISGREVTLGSRGDLTLGADVSAAGELQLNATGGISEVNGALVSTALLSGAATGAVSLGNPNAVAVLGGFTANGFTFSNSEPLTITGAVEGGSSAQIKSSSDLTLDASATVSGGSVILVDGGIFANHDGGSALTGGGWQIWSQSYANDTLDGLPFAFRQYNATFGETSPLGGGNGIFYTEAPILFILPPSSITKTYDGSNRATMTGYVIDNVLAGDYVSIRLPVSGSYDNANVGSDKSVTFSGYQIVASDAATGVPVYGYQYNPVIATTGTVTAAPLTIRGGNSSKVYDGLPYAGSFAATYSGFVNGETPSVLGGTLGFSGDALGAVNAGDYAVIPGGLTSSNYVITFVPGQLQVSPASLIVSAKAAGEVYDGPAYAGGNGVTYSGFVNGETSSVLGGTLGYGGDAQGAINVGSYAIQPFGLTSGNYDITFGAGTLQISPAPLIVTANNISKVYDGRAYAGGGGVSYSGFVNDENASVLGGTLGYGGDAQGAVNAGSYAITANGLTSGNYTISYAPGQLSVTPAPLVITANGTGKLYDGLAFTGGDGVSYSGFVNGETSSVLGGTLTYGGDAQGAVNAGPYTITANGLTSGNYTISYRSGQLWVIPAPLLITANSVGKTYDGLAFAGGDGVSYSGFVHGETPSVLGGTLGYGGDAQGAVNAGSYAITVNGLTSGNYAIGYQPGQLSVAPAPLLVTAHAAGKVYDGLGYAGGNGVSYDGFVNGEAASVLGGMLTYGGDAQAAINVGNYTITPGGLTSGNYAITFAPGSLAITPAALTVSVNAAGKTYDAQAYAGGNGVTYAGFVDGQNASVLGGTLVYGGNAQGAINTGSYGLSASGLTSGNYAISYVPAALTISPAVLTYVASPERLYDGEDPSGLGGTVTGFEGGDTLDNSTTGTLAWSTSATAQSAAGQYAILGGGLSARNYLFDEAAGNATALTIGLSGTPSGVGNVVAGLQEQLGPMAPAVPSRDSGPYAPDLRIVGDGMRLP